MTDLKKKLRARLLDLSGSPEAMALRRAAISWHTAAEADDLNYKDPGVSLKAVEKAHIEFLEAAVHFADRTRLLDD